MCPTYEQCQANLIRLIRGARQCSNIPSANHGSIDIGKRGTLAVYALPVGRRFSSEKVLVSKSCVAGLCNFDSAVCRQISIHSEGK